MSSMPIILVLLLILIPGAAGQWQDFVYGLPGQIDPGRLNFTLVPMSFDTLLFGSSSDRTFGMCNEEGQKCDWARYWWQVWLAGLWAWIVGAAVLALLLLWLLLKCCCCCCICIGECILGALCCCFKSCCSRANDTLIWTVRVIVLLEVGLGAAGFALAVIGWVDVETIANELQGNYSQYVQVTLKYTADRTTSELSNATARLTSAGALTNQSALDNVLTSTEIQSAAVAQRSIQSNWTEFNGKYVEPAREAWSYLFWVSIGVGFGTLICTLMLGIFLRCNWFLPTLLTVTGLLACALLWASIAVTGSGLSLMSDVCTEAQAIATNTSTGYGLLNTLQCTQPLESNEFAPALYASHTVLNAAAKGACGAISSHCEDGTLTCPLLPETCTTYSHVRGLPTSVTVSLNASEGGCDNNCTASQCAFQCTSDMLTDTSQGLVICVNNAGLMYTLDAQILMPLTTCTIMENTFLMTLNYQCELVEPSCVKMIWGMFILAVASFLGAFTTLLLDDFFTGTARTTPLN